jgi:hypothetical protein
MVRIKRWTGRFGNNLFQYAVARMVAERNNLFLDVVWPHDDILKVIPYSDYGRKIEPTVTINDQNYINDKNVAFRNFRSTGVIMDGYWQDSRYLFPIRDKVKSWFEPCTIPKSEGWVCHYRVSDYWLSQVSSVIDPSWYIDILRKENALKGDIVFVTEDPQDPCIKEIINKVATYFPNSFNVKSGNIKNDFNFLRSARNIICSNGSFSWWAQFLGDWDTCYLFSKWMRYHHNMDLKMPTANWVSGAFAENKEKQIEWDNKSVNGIERYWEGWKDEGR